jgi:hypothetical protein
MSSSPVYNAQHWQQRAKEMRTLADSVDGREAQAAMLRMAQHYERLATKDEERAGGNRRAHVGELPTGGYPFRYGIKGV